MNHIDSYRMLEEVRRCSNKTASELRFTGEEPSLKENLTLGRCRFFACVSCAGITSNATIHEDFKEAYFALIDLSFTICGSLSTNEEINHIWAFKTRPKPGRRSPSRSREVILQDLARFLQKRVILQDLARWRLSCKILQDGGYLARILKEGGYLARILQESCKITIPKFLSKNTKKLTEIRCKIKKIVSRTRIQNFFELISKIYLHHFK